MNSNVELVRYQRRLNSFASNEYACTADVRHRGSTRTMPRENESDDYALHGDIDDEGSRCTQCMKENKKAIEWVVIVLLVVAIHVYLVFAILKQDPDVNGDGWIALLVMICCGWAAFIWYVPLKWFFTKIDAERTIVEPVVRLFNFLTGPAIVSYLVVFGLFALVTAYVCIDAWSEKVRIMSLIGLIVQILFCILISTNPFKIKWRPVIWGIGLQFVIGYFVLRWPPGAKGFSFLANYTVVFLDYSQNGSNFVYGIAANPLVNGLTRNDVSPTLIFSSLMTVVYFGAVVGLLYHFGIIQYILVRVAILMQWTMGTTAAESLNAAACIFLGQTEAALLIKPCLSTMTESEIHSVMTAGYACIAGSLFAAYISYGACPDYLLSASAMSAPASLAISKLLMPETEKSKQLNMKEMKFPTMEDNFLEAISNGAVVSIGYVWAICANLVVIMALLAFVDAGFHWAGGMVGYPQLTFEQFTGYCFFPLAWVMGSSESNITSVKIEETLRVAELMGTKTIINEFVAYEQLGCMVQQKLLSKRPRMIATYALCGFSNIGSIGIQLGIMSGMCPEKSGVFAKVGVRGLIAGSISCFVTACVAGILLPLSDIVECPIAGIEPNCTLPY